MTEKSLFWNTSATPSGDQVKSYTQDHMSLLAAGIGGANGFEGVVPGYKGGLEITWGGYTMTVQTGLAVVDGIIYENDAALPLTLDTSPTPRMDRIVLRASWSANTVRAVVLKGDSGSYPSPPALTQTPGTTYEIELAQIDVTGSGNIVHDERRKLSSGPALAHVEQRKYLYGGEADRINWGDDSNAVQARFTANILQPVQLQAGVVLTTTPSGPHNVSITFPEPFPVLPFVMLSGHRGGTYTRDIHLAIDDLTESSFNVDFTAGSSGDAIRIHWAAWGPMKAEDL